MNKKDDNNRSNTPQNLLGKLLQFGFDSRNSEGARFFYCIILVLVGCFECFKVINLQMVPVAKVIYLCTFGALAAVGSTKTMFGQNDNTYFTPMLSYRYGTNPVKAKKEAKVYCEIVIAFLIYAFFMSLMLIDAKVDYPASNAIADKLILAFAMTMCTLAPVFIGIVMIITMTRYRLLLMIIEKYKEQDEAWPGVCKEAAEIYAEYKDKFRNAKADDTERLVKEVHNRVNNIKGIYLYEKKYVNFIELVIMNALYNVMKQNLAQILNDYKMQMEFSKSKEFKVKQ